MYKHFIIILSSSQGGLPPKDGGRASHLVPGPHAPREVSGAGGDVGAGPHLGGFFVQAAVGVQERQLLGGAERSGEEGGGGRGWVRI